MASNYVEYFHIYKHRTEFRIKYMFLGETFFEFIKLYRLYDHWKIMQELKNTTFLYFQILSNIIFKIYKLPWCNYYSFYGGKSIISKYDHGNRRDRYSHTNIGYSLSFSINTCSRHKLSSVFLKAVFKSEEIKYFLDT